MTIAIAVFLVVLAGPCLLGVSGYLQARHERLSVRLAHAPMRMLAFGIASALLYTLAFNLTFFIQELFLVIPKALTPGLCPTLFHNNHSWQGEHPLAALYQGTGALAVFLSGIASAVGLRCAGNRSPALRLFLIWMAFNGFLQSLPQVVVGALNPANDVGMALEYLQLGESARTVAALAALAAMPLLVLSLSRPLLGLARDADTIASAGGRSRFVFFAATLPALAAIPLIVLFRVPREFIEVVMPPVVVTGVGVAWLQAAAWYFDGTDTPTRARIDSFKYPAVAVVILLLLFQFVLRPGIEFC